MSVIRDEIIPLDNGLKLAARIWYPKSTNKNTRYPTIFEYIPYRKYDMTYERDSVNMNWFATMSDIVGVRVDIEGTGDSSGILYDEYLISEQTNGVKIINWIAAQSWSNGKVFMSGKSWAGFNSLQIAQLNRTTNLSGIIPLHFTHDRYENDIHYMGGCLLTANMNWSGYMFAYQYLPPSIDVYFNNDFKKWKSFYLNRLNNNNGPWIHQWLKQRFKNEYWLNGSIYTDYNSLSNIPILLIGGQIDGYIRSLFQIMDNLFHKNNHLFCIVGPWEHQFPHLSMVHGSNIHFLKYVADFIHFYSENGNSQKTFDFPQFSGFLQSQIYDKKMNDAKADIAGKWVQSKKWPKSNKIYKSIILENESIDNNMMISNSLKIGKNYTTYFPLNGAEEYAQEQSFDDMLSTLFKTNEIIDNDMNIFGSIEMNLSFKINVDNNIKDIEGMIIGRLCLVNKFNKKSKLLTWKSFNLNMLNGSKKKDFKFLKCNNYEYKNIVFKLPEIFQRIVCNKGYYLRLSLSSNYWPIIFPNKTLINIQLLNKPVLNIPIIANNNNILRPLKMKKYDNNVVSDDNIEWKRMYNMHRSYSYDKSNFKRKDILVYDEGCMIIKKYNWLVDHIFNEEYIINNINDPLSCVHTNKHKFIVGKMNDNSLLKKCEINTKIIMSCDYNKYYVDSFIDIKLNNNLLFKKEFSRSFDRRANIVNTKDLITSTL